MAKLIVFRNHYNIQLKFRTAKENVERVQSNFKSTEKTPLLKKLTNLYLNAMFFEPIISLLDFLYHFNGPFVQELLLAKDRWYLIGLIRTYGTKLNEAIVKKMLVEKFPYFPDNAYPHESFIDQGSQLTENLNFWSFYVVADIRQDYLYSLVLEALSLSGASSTTIKYSTNVDKSISKVLECAFEGEFDGETRNPILLPNISKELFTVYYQYKNNTPLTLQFVNSTVLNTLRDSIDSRFQSDSYSQVKTWPTLNVLRPNLELTLRQNDELSTKSFRHPFHLVDPSPWPFLLSIALFSLTLGTVSFWQQYETINTIQLAIILVIGILTLWWRDVIRESTYEQAHTAYVRRGLLLGMALFIISEVMFFVGFFWGFLHSSLVPSSSLGGVWPPLQLIMISPWKLPLLNTALLLTSGVTLTIAHKHLREIESYTQYRDLFALNRLLVWLALTVMLGVIFLFCQAFEYYYSPFTLQDTVYASAFYMLTGLHGMHVLVGTIFLLVCLWRAHCLHFTCWKQVGLKSAIWYWHFVDVVWLVLFLLVYVWGS